MVSRCIVLRRIGRRARALALLVLAPLGAGAAHAQGANAAADGLEEITVNAPRRIGALTIAETPRARGEPLEELTVRGQRTLSSFRFRIEAAEDRLYDLFNEINSSDEFDIRCTREPATGTRIPQRVCKPRFVADADERVAEALLYGLLFGDPNSAIGESSAQSGAAHYKRQRLHEELTRLIAENAELYRAAIELAALEQDYREARRERFGDE